MLSQIYLILMPLQDYKKLGKNPYQTVSQKIGSLCFCVHAR